MELLLVGSHPDLKDCLARLFIIKEPFVILFKKKECSDRDLNPGHRGAPGSLISRPTLRALNDGPSYTIGAAGNNQFLFTDNIS